MATASHTAVIATLLCAVIMGGSTFVTYLFAVLRWRDYRHLDGLIVVLLICGVVTSRAAAIALPFVTFSVMEGYCNKAPSGPVVAGASAILLIVGCWPYVLRARDRSRRFHARYGNAPT